jgi:4-diphosphocytidyl-2-C-methyl-D-erythritol kinase
MAPLLTPREIAVPAYAKLNLALEVVGRRSDGFHDLCSVVVIVDWHDLVSVRHERGGLGPGVAVSVDGPTAQADMAAGDGLACAAASAVRHLATGESEANVHMAVHIHKRLPVSSGLGGGSADAAGILRAVASLAAERPSAAMLLRLAAQLGSDIPATLLGGTLLLEGRGERLTPIAAPPLYLALAVAGLSSTAASYAALTDAERVSDGRAMRVAAALSTGRPPDPDDLGSALEPAAIRATPGLGTSIATLRAAVPDARWHLTGSGGAVFALAPDAADACRLAGRAAAAGYPARACRTMTAPLLSTLR